MGIQPCSFFFRPEQQHLCGFVVVSVLFGDVLKSFGVFDAVLKTPSVGSLPQRSVENSVETRNMSVWEPWRSFW